MTRHLLRQARRLARRGLSGPASVGVLVTATLIAALPVNALAWGSEGHKVTAAIAEAYLTPTTRAKVDALLKADADTLTPPDLLSRATWADAWRAAGHRETAQWHFVDIELDHADLKSACFGFPAPAHPASAGPAEDCVVDRIEAFAAELADPATSQAERILALKYLLHFVGDLHQPLHASDHQDRGGNCVRLALGGPRTTNLHSYWDTSVVQALGPDPVPLADKLRARITHGEAAAWRKGNPKVWAQETYRVARSAAYWPGAPAGCDPDAAPVNLPSGYEARAQAAAALQLEKAGVRLALLLNRALDPAAAAAR